MSAFYLTTPIYYVNALPHLGHAYTTIVADAVTRFQRLMGRDAMFITGTDEHGDKIVRAAEKAGRSPQRLADEVSGAFRNLWPRLDVAPAAFVRTTDAAHKAVVRDFLQKVHDAGDIYFGEYSGRYCYGCERFYTDKELENGLCPQHLVTPELISERNYFFRMSRYQDWLKRHILDNPDFIRPERYRSETLALLESGALEDLCISRPKSRLTWGIELPFDPNYVCYVWFDALLAYVSALGGPDSPQFARYWPESAHLVAKDILKPHAVFWPIMLKAANLPLFRHLNVHGYWLARDAKMSKSLGNVVSPLDMAADFGNDAFRYFLLREMRFGSDAGFSEEALTARLNADLANDLGNLFSRVLAMTARYRGGVAPRPGPDGEAESALQDLASESLANFRTLFGAFRFSSALESLWELVRALNKYVDSAAPWTLAKNGQEERLDTVLHALLRHMAAVATHLWPVMPTAAGAMLEQLGLNAGPQGPPAGILARWDDSASLVRPGTAAAAASNLFPRRDSLLAGREEKARSPAPAPAPPASGGSRPRTAPPDGAPPCPPAAEAKGAGAPPDTKAAGDAGIAEFADFQKLDLRVGTVTACERHPRADKLLRVMVDLGEAEARQIIAGIAEHFSPEELPGRQVTVVANLAPRMLRGLESRGMILAVRTPGGLELLGVSGPVPPGGKVS